METSYVAELRLTAFKSFRAAALPLDELTLVVGRNGSGKSNALDVTTSRSDLGDLMLTVIEQIGGHRSEVPARVMSDGTLRFLAILTSVLQAPTIDTVPADHLASDDALGQTTVVIEELENGLHASQAATLVKLIRDQVSSRRVRALATAHSPAVLDALTGEEHGSVMVCQRNPDGASSLARLVDLEDYWKIAAMGSLGRAAVADRLRDARGTTEDRDARTVRLSPATGRRRRHGGGLRRPGLHPSTR